MGFRGKVQTRISMWESLAHRWYLRGEKHILMTKDKCVAIKEIQELSP